MTQNKARRTNKIDFLQLPWAQEVRGSNPRAPTNPFNDLADSHIIARAPLCSDFCSDPLASGGKFDPSRRFELFDLCRRFTVVFSPR
jgi:hypothetical protein